MSGAMLVGAGLEVLALASFVALCGIWLGRTAAAIAFAVIGIFALMATGIVLLVGVA